MPDAASTANSRGPAASHVSTAEWQSFELRMRRRRAQRCVLNAESALASGSLDAARESLEEARRLQGPADDITRIQSLIDARALAGPSLPSRLSWRYVAAAVAVLVAGATFAAATFLRSPKPLSPAVEAQPPPTPAPAPTVTLAVQNVPAASAAALTEGTSGPDAAQPSPAAETEEIAAPPDPVPADTLIARAAPVVPSVRLEDATPGALGSAPPPDPPAATPEPAAAEAAAVSTPPSTTKAMDPVPQLRAPPPEANAPVVSPNPSSVEPAASPAERNDAPPRDESAEIRAVLARYERAYNQLDPSLARAVWPGVDERALARAFGNLASQRVVLQRCDVTTDGDSAQAVCTGSAQWTPKVGGGGPRTQNRRWTFELLKEGDAWQINRAVVR